MQSCNMAFLLHYASVVLLFDPYITNYNMTINDRGLFHNTVCITGKSTTNRPLSIALLSSSLPAEQFNKLINILCSQSHCTNMLQVTLVRESIQEISWMEPGLGQLYTSSLSIIHSHHLSLSKILVVSRQIQRPKRRLYGWGPQ